jgi:two-component system sensor histidine kinase EvgS
MNTRLAIAGVCLLLTGWGASRLAAQASPSSTRRPLLFLADEDYPPLSYVEDGAVTGIDVEIARSLSRVLGRDIRIEATDWRTAQERVLRGEGDGLLSMSVTQERRAQYDFSVPIISHEFGFFVRTGDPKANSVADLSGRRVGVTPGGIPRRLLAASSNADLVLVPDYGDGFAKLAAGELDAVAADVWVGAYTIEQRGFRNIVRSGPVFATLQGSIAVAKGNDALVSEINRALAVLQADGTIDRVLAKWRPKEVVFVTRQRMRAMLVLAIAVIAALLLVGANAIRKQRRAQARHRQAEERVHLLAQLVEHAHDIVFTVDREGYCLSMNRAGQLLSGFAAETSQGIHWTQLVVPEHRQAASTRLAAVLAGEAVPRFELDILSRDRQRLTLELDVHPILRQSTIVGAQGIARDVTVRKKLEAQLLQAQKMEAVGRLAGGVAHDFNNILTVIMTSAELAMAELEMESPLRRDLEQILTAAHSAASLTRQLLIFSRKSVATPTVIELNEAIRRLGQMLQRLVGEDIEVTFVSRHDAGYVKVDPTQLEQVVMNLLVNARDAMPTGGRLTIETGAATLTGDVLQTCGLQNAPGEFATLAITDTGIGMTPEVQAQIFVPFFTTKDSSKGTGLGLATVDGIVRQAGGFVRFESEPGVGTTFTVHLPKIAARETAASATEPIGVMERGSGTILFVEDDDAVRAVGARALRDRGYIVVTARSAESAVRAFREHPTRIDLLLTDVVMPGENGRSLATQLRLADRHLRVVFTSGYINDRVALEGIQNDGAPLIQKPYALDQLVREVGLALASPHYA